MSMNVASYLPYTAADKRAFLRYTTGRPIPVVSTHACRPMGSAQLHGGPILLKKDRAMRLSVEILSTDGAHVYETSYLKKLVIDE